MDQERHWFLSTRNPSGRPKGAEPGVLREMRVTAQGKYCYRATRLHKYFPSLLHSVPSEPEHSYSISGKEVFDNWIHHLNLLVEKKDRRIGHLIRFHVLSLRKAFCALFRLSIIFVSLHCMMYSPDSQCSRLQWVSISYE